ncbi:MAG: chemotaxis protein CheR [Burkholderiales bacterium]|nr:chemotaxis protein CheR [Burkholderiales bacterium]
MQSISAPIRPPAEKHAAGNCAHADACREFAFTPADFERVRSLIYERAGISLSEQKQEMVYSRLARRLRALGHASYRDYLDRLEADAHSPEWQEFINALTTNLTAFFREAHHFEILAQRLAAWSGRRRVRIWCTASSTGEEPYSLAMTLVEAYASWSPPAEIIATDLDTTVLATAERGVYAMERLEKVAPERVRRFFLKGTGANTGRAKVRAELRALVSFQRLNLLDPAWPVTGAFDAIFCRNVLIYFDKPTQRRIMERFRPLLAADGLLFVGHSEGLYHCTDLFRSLGKTVYERTRAGWGATEARA